MKKGKWREHVSCILYMLAFFAFLGGITVESIGSMLDFSSLTRLLCCVFAAICVIAGAIIWKAKDARGRKIKIGIMIGALVVIIGGGIIDSMIEHTSADEYVSIVLPFELSDVENVEMFHYNGAPVNAEKKIVTESNDIENLYVKFSELLLQNKEPDITAAGTSTTSFRFNLSDGTNYELIYVGYGVKKGELFSGTDNFRYFTSADIGWNWKWLNESYEAVPASVDELPTYPHLPQSDSMHTIIEEAVEHDLSKDGELLVSETIEANDVLTISPAVCTNSEEISFTNNSGADLTIYLYSFGEVIRQMSLNNGETNVLDGLNGSYPYKIGVNAETSVQVELVVTD